MDLPVNFPLGTRFWQLVIDAVADLTMGQFMLLDGSIVGGSRAARLRRRIELDGVEISEESFRQMAPPSLAEKIKAIEERAKRDPEYAKALGAALAREPGLIEKCQRVAWDLLRNADPKWHLEGAKLLLKIESKKQDVRWQ